VSCCRARRVAAPSTQPLTAVARTTAPAGTGTSSVCLRIAQEGLQLPVTLRDGNAFVSHGGMSVELGSFLGQALTCPEPTVNTLRLQMLAIYQTARTTGRLVTLQSKYGSPKITLTFLQSAAL